MTDAALSPTPKRINSIDILRGLVMMVMALDHTRDYFSDFQFDPTDLQRASTIMFLTRWVTHFCAPVFVFLSGTSAFLSMGRGKTKRQQSLQLLTRGLWLVVLEFTLVRFGWFFNVDYSLVIVQVIWTIGISMIVLSGLLFLPRWLVLLFGLALIFGHNAFDHFQPVGAAGVVWQFLHIQGPVQWGHNNTIMVIYPLIPWIGVMAVGYCFGSLFRLGEKARNRALYFIGLGAVALFVIIRGINIYGDLLPWQKQATTWRTVLAFIKCTKYPPSLDYLLMTLGPAIGLMPVLEKIRGAAGRVINVFGRVPMFYYLAHIYVIHAMALLCSWLFRGGAPVGPFNHPGYSLPVVYVFWVSALVILYFPCRWFMRLKMEHRKWWLSYL